MTQSAFLQRFQKVLLVLLLFDHCPLLNAGNSKFFFNFKKLKAKNIFMVIVSTSSYHFGFMYEIDTLFEHMQSYRTSNNKISKKVLFPTLKVVRNIKQD